MTDAGGKPTWADMSLQMNAELAKALAPLVEAAAGGTPPPVGDWQTRRTTIDAMVVELTKGWPKPDVAVEQYEATAPDGAAVPMRLYRAPSSSPGSLVVYIHGGGMIMGSLDSEDLLARELTEALGCTTVPEGSRRAPSTLTRHRSRTATRRCAGWRATRPSSAPMPAASPCSARAAAADWPRPTALIARDRGGPPLVLQALAYPMLDDRNDRPSTREILDLGIWDRAANGRPGACCSAIAAAAMTVSP